MLQTIKELAQLRASGSISESAYQKLMRLVVTEYIHWYGQECCDYERVLSSEYWAEKAKKIKEETPYCECCGSTLNLQVHHLTYNHLGFECRYELRVLCEDCHRAIHKIKDISKGLSLSDYEILDKAYKEELNGIRKRADEAAQDLRNHYRAARSAAFLDGSKLDNFAKEIVSLLFFDPRRVSTTASIIRATCFGGWEPFPHDEFVKRLAFHKRQQWR